MTNPLYLTAVGGALYFQASDPTDGTELWKSDGTASGTALVQDINPGTAGSYPFSLTNVSGVLFFAASDPTHGTELWKVNNATGSAVLVKDINPGAAAVIRGWRLPRDGQRRRDAVLRGQRRHGW